MQQEGAHSAHRRRRAKCSLGLVLAAASFLQPGLVVAAATGGPSVFGIPVDFIPFALTLIGVGVLHHHTLAVALTGLAVITAYKRTFTGFKTGAGVVGIGTHFAHEGVILTNLLGFALLSKHFEDSRVPAVLPRFVPDDWKGGFVQDSLRRYAVHDRHPRASGERPIVLVHPIR